MITMKLACFLVVCLAVAFAADAARVSRGRKLQEISWPRCICDNYRGPGPYFVTYNGVEQLTTDTKNATNSRWVHKLIIDTKLRPPRPPACWDTLLQALHKVIFDVNPNCKASFNSAGNTVRVNGLKWSNFQFLIDRPEVPLAELKVVGLINYTYAALGTSFTIDIGTVQTDCLDPAVFFKNLTTNVVFMDQAQDCCGLTCNDPELCPGVGFSLPPPPPPPIGFPHPGCGLDKMNQIPFKLEWAGPKDGNPFCFTIKQSASCTGSCCAMSLAKIEFLQQLQCSDQAPGKGPLKFKSYEDTGVELNPGTNSTAFTRLDTNGGNPASTGLPAVYGVVKANNLKWSYLDALDRTICLDMSAHGSGPVDCGLINNNFYIPFAGYVGVPYSIFDSASSLGCCGNGFLFPKAGLWPTGEPAPVVN